MCVVAKQHEIPFVAMKIPGNTVAYVEVRVVP